MPVLERVDGFPLIIAATGIAGIAGYVVTLLVYNEASPAGYAVFAVFWAGLYLVIGGLAGIQQEVARSTRPVESSTGAGITRARNFAVVAALLVFVLVVATAPAWVRSVFPVTGWALVWPLAVGVASYVLVATLSGALYGISQWRWLAVMTAGDGLLRLAVLLVALQFTHDVVILTWAVVLPFPMTIVVLWPLVRRDLVARSELDVGYGPLTRNVSRVLIASVASAALVSGFPLLLGVAAQGERPALVAELIFTITLARAPLVVSIMALQSYFVVRFRNEGAAWWRSLLAVMGIIAAGGLVLAVLAWFLGPAVFDLVSAKEVTLDGPFIALLVVSSALVGALSVTGSAVLARSAHVVYSLGWAGAAVATVVVVFWPGDLMPRVSAALIIGPTVGLVVQLCWLVSRPRISARTHGTGPDA
jgi:hypothetical protein